MLKKSPFLLFTNESRVVTSVFSDCFDHHLNILCLGTLHARACGKDISAILTSNLDQHFTIFPYFIGCSRAQQINGKISSNAGHTTYRLLGSGHIRTVEPPDGLPLRDVGNYIEPLIVTPFGKELRDETLIDKPDDNLAQRRPVESLKLFIR